MQRFISWTRVLSVMTAIIGCSGVAWVLGQRQRPARSFSFASAKLDHRKAVQSGAQRPVVLAETGARSLHGFVRTRRGRALAGATVCLVDMSGEVRISGACVETDPAGEFGFSELPNEARSVLISRQGYDSSRKVLDPVAQSLELVVDLDAAEESLAGRVVDASGGFVRGALVTLRGQADEAIAVTSSVLDGRFEIASSPGAVEVCAQAEAYSRTCSALGAPTEEHVLMLTPASRIVGRVRRQADGSGIAGASVIASNRNGLRIPARRTSSGEDGTFSIDALPAGGYEVIAVSDNSRSVEQWVAVGLAETAAPVTLWAALAVRVRGVILTADVPCTLGSLELSGPIWAQGAAAQDGSVDLDGIVAGRYDATAHCQGALSQTVSLDVRAEPVEHVFQLERLGGSSSVELAALIGGTIRATVGGEAPADIAVFANSTDGFPRRAQRRGNEFIFGQLLPGEYRVYVNDYVEQAQPVQIASEGDVVNVQLPAAAPARINGRVTSEDGAPVADAWVSASRSELAFAAGAALPTLTDADGAFNLGVAPGVPYTLAVASPFGDARLPAVTAGEEVRVHILAPASLSGRVQTAQGGSVAEFTLTYHADHDPSGHRRAGANSSFNLAMLEPDTYTLLVTSPLGSALEHVRLAPRETAKITLTLGDAQRASSN